VRTNVLNASGLSPDKLGFCMNPEFLREGRAVEDFMNPDRIVIGASDEKSGEMVKSLYASCSAKPILTSIKAAEMIKYTSNAFLATKISFSNEIGNICKKLGIDVYEVMHGVGLDSRIGTQFLNAGLGFGGSCFPKDVSALVQLAESLGEKPILLQSVLDINKTQPSRIVEQLRQKIEKIYGKKIAILGLAFKDNTDDVRDSRSIPVIQYLINEGAIIAAYDPLANNNMSKIFPDITYCSSPEDAVMDAEACLILTEWPEFSTYSKNIFSSMKNPIIIEGRKILKIDGVEGICW
jgi:UDPglucose 6-dehydrogenase